VVTFVKSCYEDKIKEDDIDEVCSTHCNYEILINIFVRNSEGKAPGTDEGIILKLICEK
jgi:hypothetical protein